MPGLGQVHDILAVESVFGYSRAGGGLLCPEAILVILEADRFSGLAHLAKLFAVLPGIAPGAVACGVADLVVSNRAFIKLCQFVFPPGTAIGVRVALCRC